MFLLPSTPTLKSVRWAKVLSYDSCIVDFVGFVGPEISKKKRCQHIIRLVPTTGVIKLKVRVRNGGSRVFTLEMLREVGFGHVVVNFTAFVCWDVCRWVVSLSDKLLE